MILYELLINSKDCKLTINSTSDELSTFNIYNSMGQEVTDKTTSYLKDKSTIEVDISNLNSGIYYLKLKSSSNKFFKN